MGAIEVLTAAMVAHVQLRVDEDGRLMARPINAVTADLRDAIAANRAELVEQLAGCPSCGHVGHREQARFFSSGKAPIWFCLRCGQGAPKHRWEAIR